MKLIDANELKKDFLGLHDCPNGFSDTYDKATIIGVVDEQPTVEAIPIEWILNHPKFPHKNEDRKRCILDMIADWKKENETD